ncbi:hypothetical protein EZL74_01105 [Flavobacterium silvisoli]|uniref:DUF5689 domain-containing protein n=1 Tax=Flavobacterium silvisoli TaxID=2529433 RepID=A0A4Q9Z4N2_9FLAO|nr:DUF5689 domain-containing protein [Flavobacterium silvisoli]TBX71130.1 hypothetical protein EZL74_01105 [Flavobacterium silvisoli]
MKNAAKFLTLSLFTTLFVGCVNNDIYNTPDLSGECNDLTATKQVSDIVATAPLSPNEIKYTGEDIIEAYVTSSDEGGNFYKSISFVSLDGSVGFSIPIDDYNLYTKYPPGTKVYVNLKDRYYTKDFGSMIIGSLYQGNSVGRISIISYQDVLTRSCTPRISEDNLVNKITIQQAKNDSYLNKLVEIDNVQFTDASVGKNYYDPSVNSIGGATNHLIEDVDGNTLTLRVSQYANFAANSVTGNSGTIRGVMTKFGTTYQFMVRTINDVKLTQGRMLPLFMETFDTNFPNWVKASVIGAQVWTLNATGNPGNCADMNGFSSGPVQNEDWLISPAIDLSAVSAATLTFQTSRPFSGNNLQVYVSTNYVAPNPAAPPMPSTATWTLLSGSLATSATWKDSGNVSLNAYTGNTNVRIAFKYTSTTSSASEWKVDNVKIK